MLNSMQRSAFDNSLHVYDKYMKVDDYSYCIPGTYWKVDVKQYFEKCLSQMIVEVENIK